eukprot:c25802_g1_i2 orf=268-1797(-)
MAEVETPLLQKVWYENCSACALERRKIRDKGAPKKELIYVALIVLCNALPISSLFPFIYFMVRDFHIAETDKDIGYYAGYIGSSFMFGRFLSSTPWGFISDKYGRKPVIIIGTIFIIIFNTAFGFSLSFWMALTSRFLLGFLNGSLGPVRAYASEICSKEHQALALSLVGTMWGLGLIIGPAIGGYLAQPAVKYPSIFVDGSLFYRFPYLLPCLCMSAFTAIMLPFLFWLPESIHKHPPLSEDVGHGVTDSKSQTDTLKISGETEENRQVAEKSSVLRNWGLFASIALYCIWGLHDMAYGEIFSLWAVSPLDYGGLGLTSSDVGIILAITGGVLLVFQMSLYPVVDRIFGTILATRGGAILSIPLVAIYPLIAKLHGSMLWGSLIIASSLKTTFSICVVTGSFLLINNSVPSEQRGVANGISMTGMSLFKSIGPACAGILFSWSQKRVNASFLPGNWMLFLILDAVCLITVIISFDPILPHSLGKPRQEVHIQDNYIDQCLERPPSFTF